MRSSCSRKRGGAALRRRFKCSRAMVTRRCSTVRDSGSIRPPSRNPYRRRAWLRFFAADGGGYRVQPHLRDMVIFACHDVFTHFPFPHLDLIVCRRRLLRDLEPAARRMLLQTFHYALEPHGVLVVDPADSFEEPQLFAPVGGDAQTYAPVGPRQPLTLPVATGAAPRATKRDGAGIASVQAGRCSLIASRPARALCPGQRPRRCRSTRAALLDAREPLRPATGRRSHARSRRARRRTAAQRGSHRARGRRARRQAVGLEGRRGAHGRRRTARRRSCRSR